MVKSFLIKLALTVTGIWLLALILLWDNYTLLWLGVIAFSLGLRHGLDVDHIVAIDNITRKLSFEKKPSITTGLYFALGHSTIVFLLTVVIILGVITFKGSLGRAGDYGGVIGTLVSAGFLWLTAFMNLTALKDILNNRHTHQHFAPRGIIARLAKRLFNLVDKPRKMYLVGFFFGLGFDTATEVALLGMAASATLHGIKIWMILTLPILFAAGMVIMDSLDSVCMTNIYQWANRDNKRLRTYNLIIIAFATISAFLIGALELVGLGSETLNWQNILVELSSFVGDNSEWFGASIALVFISIWVFGYFRQARAYQHEHK